eukprot:3505963-Rhodomonas_salina.1
MSHVVAAAQTVRQQEPQRDGEDATDVFRVTEVKDWYQTDVKPGIRQMLLQRPCNESSFLSRPPTIPALLPPSLLPSLCPSLQLEGCLSLALAPSMSNHLIAVRVSG